MTHFADSVHNPRTKSMDALYIKGRELAAGAIQWQGGYEMRQTVPPQPRALTLYYIYIEYLQIGTHLKTHGKQSLETLQHTYLLLTTKKALVKSVFFVGA